MNEIVAEIDYGKNKIGIDIGRWRHIEIGGEWKVQIESGVEITRESSSMTVYRKFVQNSQKMPAVDGGNLHAKKINI